MVEDHKINMLYFSVILCIIMIDILNNIVFFMINYVSIFILIALII